MLDKIRQRIRVKKWRKANPEKQKAYFERYVGKPGIREKRRESTKRWRKNNPEKVKAQKKRHDSKPEVKERRYAKYRALLGAGHHQSLVNYVRLLPKGKLSHLGGVMQHYNTRKEFLGLYKSERGCKVCGEKDRVCLDFHHRDARTKNLKLRPNKNRRTRGSWFVLGFDLLQKELALVDVLCANCHRKLHRDEKEKVNER